MKLMTKRKSETENLITNWNQDIYLTLNIDVLKVNDDIITKNTQPSDNDVMDSWILMRQKKNDMCGGDVHKNKSFRRLSTSRPK